MSGEFKPKNGIIIPDQNATTVPYLDANKKLTSSSVTPTELEYVSGVTSSLQTQLDGKADDANPVITGTLDASASTNVDLATTNTASTVDIGTGTGANTINIGGANSTVNIIGSVNNQNVTNMNVTDKLVTINDGGAAASGGSAGIEVEEDGSATAYIQTSSDRNSWQFKAPNTNGVATLTPGASADDVVLRQATQTLTNKTLTTPSTDIITLDGQASAPSSPSAGNYKVYVSDSTQKLTVLDSNGTATTVGSGSGTKNYITNGDFEAGTTGWTITKNTVAATTPDSGFVTSGTSNTITIDSSTPLRDSKSGLYTLAAQGNQLVYDFTIDTADKYKVLQGVLEYSIHSGTFASDAVTVWIYDGTSFIQPAPYLLKNHSLPSDKLPFEFQATGSTSYKLVLHQAAASTAVLKLDGISVGPQAKLYGSAVTDWVSYTPTITGFGTPSGVAFVSRKVGDTLQVRGSFTSGTSTAVEAQITLGFGGVNANVTTDSSKNLNYPNGDVTVSLNSATQFGWTAIPSSGNNYFKIGSQSSTANGNTAANGNAIAASGNVVSVFIEVPILGWSSSQVMSSDAATTVVAAQVTSSDTPTFATGTPTKATWSTTVTDSHGMADLTNDRFNILVPGDYRFSANYFFNSIASTANGSIQLNARVNGTTSYIMGAQGYASGVTQYRGFAGTTIIRNLKAGDYVELVINQDIVATITALNSLNHFELERISGPSQIMMSETVAARYTSTAGAAVPDADNTVIDFATKDYDTHGAVTTGTSWKFTAPISGIYEIDVNCLTTTNATISFIVGRIRKGGTAVKSTVFSREVAASSYIPIVIGTRIRLLAGEYVDFVAFESTNANTWGTGTGDMSFEIIRVGNY